MMGFTNARFTVEIDIEAGPAEPSIPQPRDEGTVAVSEAGTNIVHPEAPPRESSIDDSSRYVPSVRSPKLWCCASNLHPEKLERSKLTPGTPSNTRSGPGHCIFLCLGGPGLSKTVVVVKCKRPNAPRGVQSQTLIFNHEKSCKSGVVTYYPKTPDEQAIECDSDIFQRLQHAAISKHGSWKAWVPFYGVTSVEEVTFKFEGSMNRDGSYPIRMTRLDVDKIRSDCVTRRDTNLAIAGTQSCLDVDQSWCEPGYGHSDDCDFRMTHLNQECAKVKAERASAHLERLGNLCNGMPSPLHPRVADLEELLSGMAQDSCVYVLRHADRNLPHSPATDNVINALPDNIKEFNTSVIFRGLFVKFGWQSDEMKRSLPIYLSSTIMMASMVWLCTLIIAGSTGDWQSACGLGSLALASIVFLRGRLQH